MLRNLKIKGTEMSEYCEDSYLSAAREKLENQWD
jgi:hypothetical protein